MVAGKYTLRKQRVAIEFLCNFIVVHFNDNIRHLICNITFSSISEFVNYFWSLYVRGFRSFFLRTWILHLSRACTNLTSPSQVGVYISTYHTPFPHVHIVVITGSTMYLHVGSH